MTQNAEMVNFDAAWNKFTQVEMEHRADFMPGLYTDYEWPDNHPDFQMDALSYRLRARPDVVQDWEIAFAIGEPPCDHTDCACYQLQLFEVAEYLYLSHWHRLNGNQVEADYLLQVAQVTDEYGFASFNWWMENNIEGYAELVDQINEIGDMATE